MAIQKKSYMPEQINGAEKMCQLLQDIQNENRKMYLVSMAMTYINAFEAGVAWERDANRSNY